MIPLTLPFPVLLVGYVADDRPRQKLLSCTFQSFLLDLRGIPKFFRVLMRGAAQDANNPEPNIDCLSMESLLRSGS